MRVAIAGAGIAGLSTAILLARAGHEVHVLERAASPSPLGSGLLLQPPGLEVLRRMGLLEAALERGARIRRLQGLTRAGRAVLALDYEDWEPGCFGLGLHRGAFWHLLDDTARRAGASIHAAMDVADAGAFEGYDLALVTAGARTALRASLGFGDRTRPYEWGALWATVPLPAGWDGAVLAQRFDGTRRMMGMLPVGHDAGGQGPWITMFWSVRVAEVEALKDAGWPAWRDAVRSLWPEAHAATAGLPGFDALTPAIYSDVQVSPWCRGNLGLAGDAAHGTSPQLGQGATLALLDAEALRDALAAERDVPRALLRYEASRRSHAAYYQWASRMLTPFFQSDGRALGWLRDAFMGIAGRLPIVGRESLATLTGHKSGILPGRRRR